MTIEEQKALRQQQNRPQTLNGVMIHAATGKIVERKTIDLKTKKETITFQDPEYKKLKQSLRIK